jgi:NAD+ synthetase
VRKCGFSRVVIGLSGGIDSGLTAAIAVEALGRENVTGIAMPSQYSSEHSVKDARELACKLGIRFEIIPIGDIFNGYRKTLAPLFSRLPESIAEENIQSRIRGNILMAFSNKFGELVLTTGNKSELGVGYCTLYGDMVGGLGVISDVPKTMVYEISRYVNSLKPVIPQSTIDKPPSAELRPDQKDSDSLPPYDALDNILEDYVEDYHTAEQISADRGYDLQLVRDVIRMIERSEYKRQQAAPGLKITPKAFGVGRRFPIAQKSEV